MKKQNCDFRYRYMIEMSAEEGGEAVVVVARPKKVIRGKVRDFFLINLISVYSLTYLLICPHNAVVPHLKLIPGFWAC